MGWFDRVAGDIFEATWDIGATSLGMVTDTAKAYRFHAGRPGHFQGSQLVEDWQNRKRGLLKDHRTLATFVAGEEDAATFALNKTIQNLQTTYSYGIARPLSTFQQATGASLFFPGPTALINQLSGRERPSLSQAWKNSKKVSPGMAAMVNIDRAAESLTGRKAWTTDYLHAADLGTKDEGYVPPKVPLSGSALEKLRAWGKSGGKNSGDEFDPWFSLFAGSTDGGVALLLDPLFVAGKAVKVAKVAKKANQGDVSALGRVWHLAEPVEGTTRRQRRFIHNQEQLLDDWRGIPEAERAYRINAGLRKLKVRNASTLSVILASARNESDMRLAWSAALGDLDALRALGQQQETLAIRISRLNDELDDMLEVSRLSGGTIATMPGVREHVELELRALRRENTMYDRIMGTADETTVIPTPDDIGIIDAARGIDGFRSRLPGIGSRPVLSWVDKHRINASADFTLQQGIGGIAVRVRNAPTNWRPTGVIDVHDADSGVQELDAMLRRVPNLPADERVAVINRYMAAADDNARFLTLTHIEDDIIRHLAPLYGYEVEDAMYLLKHMQSKRNEARLHLKSTNYAVLEDGTVMHRPISPTHLANYAPTLDVDLAKRLLKRNAQRYKALRLGGAGFDILRDMGEVFNDLWKFQALFRLGYVARNIMDNQLRLMAYLGVIDAVAMDLQVGLSRPRSAGTGTLRGFDDTPYANRVEDAFGPDADSRRLLDKGVSGVPSVGRLVFDTPEAGDAVTRALGRLDELRGSGSWDTVMGDDPRYLAHFERLVNQHFRRNPIAMRLLAGEDNATVVAWLKSPDGQHVRRRLLHVGDTAEELVVANQLALRQALPEDWWATVAERPITGDDINAMWPENVNVAGRGRPAINAEQIAFSIGSGPVAEARDYIIRRYFDIVSRFSDDVWGRHPIYIALYRGRMRGTLLDKDPNLEGTISAVEQVKLQGAARMWAKAETKRIMFDLASKTDLAHFVRFVMPFFAAWQDAMVKYSRLIVRDPSLIARGAQVWTAPNDSQMMFDVVDEKGFPVPSDQSKLTGSEYVRLSIDLPFVGRHTADISKTSLNFALQGDPVWAPGWGPFGQIPVNEMAKHFDEPRLAEVAQDLGILPFGVQDAGKLSYKMLLAGAARPFGVPEARRMRMRVAILNDEYYRWKTGQRKNPPRLEEINNKYKKVMGLRHLTAALAPFSISWKSPNQFWIDMSHHYDSMIGVPGGFKDATEADIAFLRDFGDDIYTFRASHSDNRTGVFPSREADSAARKHKDLVNEHPEFGWLIAGPDNMKGEYDQNVYALQSIRRIPGTTHTWRDQYDDPRTAAQRANSEVGWIRYQNLMSQLEAIRIQRGLPSLRVKAAADLRNIREQWFQEILDPENGPKWAPDWYDEYNTFDTGRTVRLLRTVRAMSEKPGLRNRPDVKILNTYRLAREEIREILQERKLAGGSGSITTESNGDLAQAWDDIVGILLEQDPVYFGDLYTRYFEKDDLTKAVN